MRINHITVCLISVLVAGNAPAANLIVTNTNDHGTGTLRQQISLNESAGGGNTIIFSNNVTGTITLTSGALSISSNVTILGPGSSVLAISGNGSYGVFRINSGIVNISGLTITNGHAAAAGGIYNLSSNLTVSACTLVGNWASSGGAVYNDASTLPASVNLSACTLIGNSATNGGAIYNDAGNGVTGLVSVSACTLSSNSVISSGGAIYNEANNGFAFVTVSACTLSSNSAANGGAIYNDSHTFGEVDLITSTLSGNSAAFDGGGIFSLGHPTAIALLKLSACTLSSNSAANGGGIYSGRSIMNGFAELDIGDTILNAGSSGSNIVYEPLTTVVSLGYNLSSDPGSGVLTNATDQINTDPTLGPLADNGGPTLTHALLPGSPAIDRGMNSGLTTDQRGLPRPVDNPCVANAAGGDGSDIGAFESQAGCTNFAITSITLETNDVRIEWTTYAGKTNVLERTAGNSGNFATNNFSGITNITTTGTSTNYLDVGAATNAPALYYRVRLVP